MWDIKTGAWKGNKRLLRGDDFWAACVEVSRNSSDERKEGHAKHEMQRLRGVKQHGTFGTGEVLCIGNDGQKIVHNLCSYIKVGIFFRW